MRRNQTAISFFFLELDLTIHSSSVPWPYKASTPPADRHAEQENERDVSHYHDVLSLPSHSKKKKALGLTSCMHDTICLVLSLAPLSPVLGSGWDARPFQQLQLALQIIC
jgi:hypothetical protein